MGETKHDVPAELSPQLASAVSAFFARTYQGENEADVIIDIVADAILAERRSHRALIEERDRLREEEQRLRKLALDYQAHYIAMKAALEKIANETARCQHDGGFDREIGPIGCYLGDKCVCIGIHPIARDAVRGEA